MATERTTHNQRRLLVGLLVATTSLAVILGITALNAGGEDKTSVGATSRPAPPSTESVRSPVGRPTTTTVPAAVDTSTAGAGGDAAGTSPVAAGGDAAEPSIGTTGECRADPACPSSEHRTSDPCGAALITDQDGYLEGRRDAEQGRPYGIDGAPAPGPADEDDDDGTVGPETRYRAGYVQGWCDGGAGLPPS